MAYDKDRVEVEVVAFERVEYRQRLVMPKRVYDEINSMLDENDEEGAAALAFDYIDRGDVLDSDDQELAHIQIAGEEND